MTLYRQLIIVILVLFMAIFAGSFFISINNTRQYLSEQLLSHAQDTATSLGLSVSPHIQNKDPSTIASMVDAIYDRGYYTEVSIEYIDNKPLYGRSQKVFIEGIPAWFVTLVPLDAPRAEALIMAGWHQAAKIYIRSHPGYAYRQLWKSTLDTFWLFLSAAITTFLIGMLAIRIILRPLNAIRDQAEAICAREFPIQQNIPRTPELRSVVQAMNKMSLKVKSMFDEMSLLTEKLRNQAYLDPVTNLGNRRYLDSQLQHLVDSSEEFYSGALFLFELHDFKHYNEQHGYQAGDRLLKQASDLLKTACAEIKEYFAMRIAGGTFVVLIPNITRDQAKTYGESFTHAIAQLQIVEQRLTQSVVHIGIAHFSKGQTTATDLLAKADMALRAAQQEGGNTWRLYEEQGPQTAVHGAQYWRQLLDATITQQNIVLYFQPVVGRGETPPLLHHEILMRIPDHEGKLLSAGVFMPMAESLGLASELDKVVIEKVLQHAQANIATGQKYAINLSASSLNASFFDWLTEKLKNADQLAKHMIFEMTEFAAINNLDLAQQLIAKLARFNCQITLDHFGRGFSTFGYLRSLKVNYLKIDGSYIRGIDKQVDNQFFVHSLVDIAHSLDIHVIVENVETESERGILSQLLVDGMQGYLIGAPSE